MLCIRGNMMAKIIVNVDTESEVLEVSVNGEILPDVQSVNIGIGKDYYGNTELSTNICLVNKDKESGITRVTYLVAKDTKEGRDAISAGAKFNRKHNDLVELGGTDKVKQDIMSYFSRP
jgi:hypothetical protein